MSGFTGAFTRHRPMLVAIVAVVIVVLLLPRSPDDEAAPVVGAGPAAVQGAGTDAPGFTGTESSELATGVPAGDTGAPLADGTSPAASPSGAVASSGGGGAAAPGSYPGLGSPEALQNPECDPETGRVRIPWQRMPQCARDWPSGADNGGPTAQGVTADKITVVIRMSSDAQSDDAELQREALASYATVADHLESWGRKVDFKFHKSSGTDEIAQRADAVDIATKFKPFAVINPNPVSVLPVWEGELAARGIVVFGWQAAWAHMQKQPGYRWTFGMDDGVLATHVSEFVGKRLGTRPAKWAGDPTYQASPRKYGLLYPETLPFDLKGFKERLAARGVQLAEVIAYPKDLPAQQEHVRTAIAKFKEKGVTSIITFHELVYGVLITQQATKDRYLPEWVVTGFANHDTYVISKLMDQTQWAHAFGVGTIGTPVQGFTNPVPEVYKWHHGRPPEDNAVAGGLACPMWQFLGGIHLTGPNLTMPTLRQAMFNWKPNGGRWEGMTTLGNEGFSYGAHNKVPWDDYTGMDDLVEKWWDTSTSGTDEIGLQAPPGVYWKINGGKRYAPGEYPEGEPPFFNKSGAVESHATYPEPDKPPPYPHKAPQ